jgi:hypothetical protein
MFANLITLAHFFSFRSDELGELAGRAGVRLRTQIRKTRLECRIGERSIDFFLRRTFYAND